MSLSLEEKKVLIDEIGEGAAKKLEGVIESQNQKMNSILEEAKKNKGLTEDQYKLLKESQEEMTSKFDRIAKEQGKTLEDLRNSIQLSGTMKGESIKEILKKNEDKLRSVYNNGNGNLAFEVFSNNKGEVFAKPYDASKAAYSHATIDDVDNAANVASIAQSLDAASILRMGGDAPIVTQYRNTPYIFDLCNTFTVNSDKAIWMEESATIEGGSSAVVEGATKPLSQYFYTLKSETFKKQATLLTFTDEFDLDFQRLEQQTITSAKTDLVNGINTAILARILTAATAFNIGATFAPLIDKADPNDFDVIAAMAAQADSATFGGAISNAALMSTLKKYAMGLTTDTTLAYINAPDIIRNIAFVGNAGMATDNIIVGDFKQYNIQLRGGMIMRVGYNGTNFAENKFSVVLEQRYFDYISAIRAKALVKGTTFATVKAAIDNA